MKHHFHTIFIHFIIQKYLSFSTRVIAYTANFYFSEIINPFFLSLFRNPPYSKLLLFILGIIFYEITDKIVNTYYKPKFFRKDEVEREKEKRSRILGLDKESYEYRVRTEKIFLILAFYYGVNLTLSSFIYFVLGLPGDTLKLTISGVGGGIVSLFNFFGLALFVSKAETKAKEVRVFLKIIGLGLILGPAFYVFHALSTFFS